DDDGERLLGHRPPTTTGPPPPMPPPTPPAPPIRARLARLALALLAPGAPVLVTTASPSLSPLTISVASSPLSPVTTVRRSCCLPFSTLTNDAPPAVVTADDGSSSTLSALSTVTCTEAVMPGFTPLVV